VLGVALTPNIARWCYLQTPTALHALLALTQHTAKTHSYCRRFGNVTSCDIIRDFKTGDSLCYGFIGYDNDAACEAAYFKMNNVLIDDRWAADTTGIL
jgi:hypothetical protein